MPIFLGGLGGLTPGILGVGAAAIGGAVVVNQMMDSCPATRPCQVASDMFVLFTEIILLPGEEHCAFYRNFTVTRCGTH